MKNPSSKLRKKINSLKVFGLSLLFITKKEAAQK